MAKKSGKIRKPRVKKDSYLKDNYVVVNTTEEGKSKIVTRVMHIRTIGSIVETTISHNDVPVAVTTSFVPGIKVKTKKDWKYLIKDVPKKKKEKK